jgi:hypothetical protein
MKYIKLTIILLFIIGITFANDKQLTVQDTTQSIMLNSSEQYRYPGKAMIFSGLIPGMGELYSENWKRAIVFMGIELASWITWSQYENKGEEQTIKFELFADEHWNFNHWIDNYENWNIGTLSGDSSYPYYDGYDSSAVDQFRLFSHYDDYDGDWTYSDIWESSHGIAFSYYDNDGNLVSMNSSDSGFEEFYNSYVVGDFIPNDLYVVRDQHYYENIGKYNLFYAGWDDSENLEIFDNDRYLVAKSPNKWFYRSERTLANEYKTYAGYAVSAVLLNHVVSMIDAVFTTQSYNKRKISPNISARTTFNPDNKFGIGGVQVSFNW